MSEIVTVVAVEPPTAPRATARNGESRSAAALLEALALRFDRHGGAVAQDPRGGIDATFATATEAVTAAIDAQQMVSPHEDAHPALQIGLDVAEATPGQRFRADTLASHARSLARQADPGQILVTALVHGLVANRPDTAYELAPTDLGSAAGQIYEVGWSAASPALTRVAVADDAALIRSGLVQLLESAGFLVTAEAADAEELLAAVAAEPPDLVVTDIRMPPSNTDEGLVAAATIRAEHPGVAILVLSQHIESRAAAALLDGQPAGIGYLLKERITDLDDFVEACTTVANGGSVIDPLVSDELLRHRRHDDTIQRLSERETEVLALMAQGRSNSSIAGQLHVGAKTVETHVSSIFRKLNIAESPEGNRRVQAVLNWLQH